MKILDGDDEREMTDKEMALHAATVTQDADKIAILETKQTADDEIRTSAQNKLVKLNFTADEIAIILKS